MDIFHRMVLATDYAEKVLHPAPGSAAAPFEAATLAAYAQVLKATTGNPEAILDVTQAQSALQALQALQDKALVWRAARGVYALEESSLAELMAAQGLLDPVPQPPAR